MARVIRRGNARVTPLATGHARGEDTRVVGAGRERRLREERLAELTLEAHEAARAELAAAHLEVERARQALLADAETTVATLALAIARRLVGEDLEAHPERVRALVLEALGRVRRATRARVRVHPSDAAQLVDLDVAIVADAAIERGGCMVESEIGNVDARLEARLDALARALASARRS
jgi:flagellar assembly protein FliH